MVLLSRQSSFKEIQGSKQAQESGETQGWKMGAGGIKNGQKNAVLRMRFSIVENVRISSDVVLVTSRGTQLPYRRESKQHCSFLPKTQNPVFPVFSSIVELSDRSPWWVGASGVPHYIPESPLSLLPMHHPLC